MRVRQRLEWRSIWISSRRSGECDCSFSLLSQRPLSSLGTLKPRLQLIDTLLRYKIITSPLTSVDPSKSDTLTVNFDSHPSISLGYINLLPQAMSPNADALPFLPKSLLDADLTPMGTVPIIKPDALGEGDMKLPPGFGDDPRTPVKGAPVGRKQWKHDGEYQFERDTGSDGRLLGGRGARK